MGCELFINCLQTGVGIILRRTLCRVCSLRRGLVRLPVPKVFCEACEKTLDFVRTNYYSLPIKLRDWLSAAQLTGLRVNERSKNVGFWKDFFEAV